MKTYILSIISLLFIVINVHAQKDNEKLPTQAELQTMMHNAQGELDKLDPETKRMMDSMGIKMPGMNTPAKIISQVGQGQLQKEWDRQNSIVPAKDAGRIAAIAATPSTASISNYIKSSQSKIFASLPSKVKTTGDKLYALFISSKKTAGEIGNAAAGLWMLGKTEIAFYLMSKTCADNALNNNNLSNYAAMLSMAGNEETAIPLLNYLNARLPENSTILNNLGQAWFGLGDINNAEKYLDNAIRIFGAHTQATLTKAKIEESKGNTKEAVKLVKKSIKEAYSQEKNAYLQKLGYSITTNDVTLPQPAKPDQFNLGSFQPPPFPKNVAECITLQKDWQQFKASLKPEIERLEKEVADAAPAIASASQQRFKGEGRITPMHVDVANKNIAEVNETYNRKVAAWQKKFQTFVEGYGKELRDNYEAKMDKLKEQDLKQTGEGQANEAFCPKYRGVTNEFLSAYNSEMEIFYKEFLNIQKVYYNETAYYSIYALWPEELKVLLPTLKASWLASLAENVNFESITTYTCEEPGAKSKGGKLAKFDDVACQYHSELNLLIGSIKMDCSHMYSELDLNVVKIGLNQDMDKETFENQFVSCTVEVSAGVGKAEAGPIAVGPEIGGGLGIEIDRSGVSDVYVTGKAEVGAELGPFSTSKGFEGRISLVSGACSGGFK